MYSVVIADDEINICEGLKNVLEKHCPEITICGAFFNGRELLEFLHSNHADIIITDIRMPEISGLQIAEFIYTHRRNSHVIITTGYKEFEYAQQAINYKVSAFLTKPFAFKEMIQKIREIENMIDIESSSAIKEDKLYLNNWQVLKSLLTAVYDGDPRSRAENLSIFFRNYIALSDFKCYEITYTNTQPDVTIPDRAAEDFGEWISETELRCFIKCTTMQCVCIVLYKDAADIYKIISEFVGAMQLHCSCVLHYNYLSFPAVKQWIQHCVNRSFMETYLAAVSEKGYWSALEISGDKLHAFSGEQLQSLYQYILACNDLSSIMDNPAPSCITAQDILDILKKIENVQSDLSKSDHLIQAAQRYIQSHYQNPNISLSEIANQLCVNANYLGQAIKKKTGKRFVDLLLQTRMEEAKRLLTQTNMPVKEIAYAVGYNQVPYFRQQFKNYYGITPTSYKGEEQNKE